MFDVGFVGSWIVEFLVRGSVLFWDAKLGGEGEEGGGEDEEVEVLIEYLLDSFDGAVLGDLGGKVLEELAIELGGEVDVGLGVEALLEVEGDALDVVRRRGDKVDGGDVGKRRAGRVELEMEGDTLGAEVLHSQRGCDDVLADFVHDEHFPRRDAPRGAPGGVEREQLRERRHLALPQALHRRSASWKGKETHSFLSAPASTCKDDRARSAPPPSPPASPPPLSRPSPFHPRPARQTPRQGYLHAVHLSHSHAAFTLTLYTARSLPSRDSPTNYDSTDSDSDQPTAPFTTNRGHKLTASARNLRRGRLGDYPHTEIGFPSPAQKRRKKTLDSSTHFPLAPNLHFLAKSDPDQPAQAILPPAPQSPLDLLLSTATQHTLGPKNAIYKTLAMSATGLIEQEGALVGALRRVCAGLRGEAFDFRWEGDEEIKRQREQVRRAEDAEEDERYARLEDAAMEEARAEAEAEFQAETERITLLRAAEAVQQEIRAREQAEEDARLAVIAAAEAEAARIAELAAEEVRQRLAAEAKAAEDAAALAESVTTVAATLAGSSAAASTSSTINSSLLASLPPLDQLITQSNGILHDADITMDEPTLSIHDAARIDHGSVEPNGEGDILIVVDGVTEAEGGEGDDEEDDEPATRRRSGRVASRQLPSHRSGSASESEFEEHTQPLLPQSMPQLPQRPLPIPRPVRPKRIAIEQLPEYATRLVDPEVFVRSLFVSEGAVGVPVSIQGGPPGSTEVDLLSPNEQEVMVHDCLTYALHTTSCVLLLT